MAVGPAVNVDDDEGNIVGEQNPHHLDPAIGIDILESLSNWLDFDNLQPFVKQNSNTPSRG
eukprot:4271721-Karenia_brevis.AAC.1